MPITVQNSYALIHCLPHALILSAKLRGITIRDIAECLGLPAAQDLRRLRAATRLRFNE